METLNSTPPQDIPRKRGKGYPEPLIVLSSQIHSHSVILLHGRGSNATRFGLELLKSKTSSGKTLQELFPSVKFIFPTASRRRSTILKRVPINQWFDSYSLEDPTERQDLQYEGLRETTEFIGRIVLEEAATLTGGVGNVILGGLSQGCATALIASLSFIWTCSGLESSTASINMTGSADTSIKSLGGFIGMSGWLPFAQGIISATEPDLHYDNEEDDDLFETADTKSTHKVDIVSTPAQDSCFTRLLRASNYIRDLIDLAPIRQDVEDKAEGGHASISHLYTTSYFLGHGTLDEKVSVSLGQQSRATLSQLGLDVTWKSYDGEGHWYKVPDELDDIVSFLRDKMGILSTES